MSEQFFVDGRPVSELKVVELRKELELRSLPKSGNKKELVERLENFLRDEQAEMRRQQQQQQEQQKIEQQVVVQQQQAEPEEADFSPNAAAAVKPADMVAQYLAQQQIQLEAARRDADKLRASTSSSTEEGPGEEQPTQMVQESPKQQPAAAESADAEEDTLAKKSPEKFKVVEAAAVTTTASAEFIPEEPTSQSVEQEEEEVGGEFVPDEPEQQQKREAKPKEENLPKDVTTTADEVEVQSSTAPSTSANEAKAEEEEEEAVKEDNVELDLEEGEEEYVEEEEEDDDESEPDERRRRQHSPITAKDTHQTTSIQDSHVSSVSDQAEAAPAPAANGGQPGQVSVVHHQQQATQQESSSVVVPSAAPLGQSRRHSSSAAAHQVAEESSKPVYEPETTQDGLTRRRPASPARNPPSRWLHIRGLKRPFTNRGLLELLGKFGTVDTDHFWIDSIKSNCIVTFEAEEQAQLARERLHNVVWPPANDGCLVVEYSTEEKLNRRKQEDEQSTLPSSLEAKLFPGAAAMSLQERSAAFGGPLPVPAPGGLGLTIVVDNRKVADSAGPQVHIQHDKEQMLEAENRKRKAEELVRSQKTLDELFKKTTTLPSLYFLPLSDEQAAKRTKYSSNSSSKAHASASRSGHSSGHHRDREDNHRATSRSGAGGGGREDRRGAGAVQGDGGGVRDDRHGRSAGGSHSRR